MKSMSHENKHRARLSASTKDALELVALLILGTLVLIFIF